MISVDWLCVIETEIKLVSIVILCFLFQKLVQEKAGDDEFVKVDDMFELLEDLKEFNLFEGVETADELLDYLQENGGLVKPIPVVLKSEQIVLNGKLVTKPVDFFHLVPFLKQLERLLQCKDVLHCVDNRKAPEGDMLKSVLDGTLYLQNVVVLNNADGTTITVLFYHDGVDVTDSASARAGKHAMTFFYWILGDIYPEFRSSDKVVQLYAVIKTETLKQYGYGPVLENFIEGMNKLSSLEGVTMNLCGEERKIHGILQASCADYPANAAIGGFKESVSAEKPCGICLASNEENYLQISDIDLFERRTKEMHQDHLNEVANYMKMTTREKAALGYNPSVLHGVNRRSELLDINYFDVTKALVPDLMHVVHEGVLEFVCRLVLIHVIKEEGTLTLPEVNARIQALSKAFERDRPGVILDDHLSPKKKLRQSACQMRVLSLILPFALQKKMDSGEMCFAGNRDYLDCLLSLTKVLNFCLAYEFHVSDVPLLRQKIKVFHDKLLRLVPDISMAKAHFLHHLADQIELQGGIRQVACFRFEAHHRLFKILMKIIRNFINPTESLSNRHQAKQCHQMMEGNYLYGGHQYTVIKNVTALNDRNINRAKMLFPNSKLIEELSRLKIHGTLFKESTLILMSESELPDFGMIKKIYMLDKKKFAFICQKVATVCLADDLNAFRLSQLPALITVDAEKLLYPHTIISLKWQNQWYALLLGHRKLLT